MFERNEVGDERDSAGVRHGLHYRLKPSLVSQDLFGIQMGGRHCGAFRQTQKVSHGLLGASRVNPPLVAVKVKAVAAKGCGQP